MLKLSSVQQNFSIEALIEIFIKWLKNVGLDENKLTNAEYLLKRLEEATNNESPAYNLEVFANAAIRYAHLHHSMFGGYDGWLMPRPSKDVLKLVNGTFTEFLQTNNLTTLLPYLEMDTTTSGYGYLDEIGALYGLLWFTPKYVLRIALQILGFEKDPYRGYVLKNGFEEIWIDKHRYAWILHRYASICVDMHAHAWICMDMHGHASICTDMREYASVCIEMH